MGNKKAAAQANPEGPPFPEPLDYLWSWFNVHSRGLASGGEGYPPVTWEGLRAWSAQMHIDLEPWEAETLITLGFMRVNIYAEHRAAEIKKAMAKK
jgi:hypothetical protein